MRANVFFSKLLTIKVYTISRHCQEGYKQQKGRPRHITDAVQVQMIWIPVFQLHHQTIIPGIWKVSMREDLIPNNTTKMTAMTMMMIQIMVMATQKFPNDSCTTHGTMQCWLLWHRQVTRMPCPPPPPSSAVFCALGAWYVPNIPIATIGANSLQVQWVSIIIGVFSKACECCSTTEDQNCWVPPTAHSKTWSSALCVAC